MKEPEPVAPPIDQSRLRAVTGGNAAVERELLIDYRESTREDAADVREAVKSRNAKALARAAHRIKGASWIVGALVLAADCEQLEAACRAKKWNEIDACLPRFEKNLALLYDALDPL